MCSSCGDWTGWAAICPTWCESRSWKHVNFYGEYNFRDASEIVDLDQMVSRLAALEWDSAGPKQPN